MSPSLPRAALIVALATLFAFGSAADAHASSFNAPEAKLKIGKLIPKVKFKPKASLSKTGARVKLDVVLSFGGKSKRLKIFDMGLKKKGKSVRVQRKVGKLKVSLTVTWSGTREIVIRGSARYLKFKVPVPKLRIKV